MRREVSGQAQQYGQDDIAVEHPSPSGCPVSKCPVSVLKRLAVCFGRRAKRLDLGLQMERRKSFALLRSLQWYPAVQRLPNGRNECQSRQWVRRPMHIHRPRHATARFGPCSHGRHAQTLPTGKASGPLHAWRCCGESLRLASGCGSEPSSSAPCRVCLGWCCQARRPCGSSQRLRSPPHQQRPSAPPRPSRRRAARARRARARMAPTRRTRPETW